MLMELARAVSFLTRHEALLRRCVKEQGNKDVMIEAKGLLEQVSQTGMT